MHGTRAANGPTTQTNAAPEARGDQAPRPGRDACRHRPHLQRQPGDDFTAGLVNNTMRSKEELDTFLRQQWSEQGIPLVEGQRIGILVSEIVADLLGPTY